MNFKDMPTILFVLNEGVYAFLLIAMAGEELLDLLVVKEVLLGQAEDLEGLLLGHKAPLNSKAFGSNFFSELITVFLGLFSSILLLPEISNFRQSFLLTESILLG